MTDLSGTNKRHKSCYNIIHHPVSISEVSTHRMRQIIKLTNIGQNRYYTYDEQYKNVDIERIRDTAAELAQSVERLTPEGKDVGSINRAGLLLRVLKKKQLRN